MHITDQAFILKLTKYQETSYIASLLSSKHGLIQTISKGVRQNKKNSQGSIFEVGNLIDIELRIHPLKNLQYLQKIHFRDSISQGQFSPLRQSIILLLMEISEKSLADQSDQNEIFTLLYSYFEAIKNTPKQNLYPLPLLYTLDVYQVLGYPIEEWLQLQNVSLEEIKNGQGVERHKLLDNLLWYIDQNFQPLRKPKSLEVLRTFIQSI